MLENDVPMTSSPDSDQPLTKKERLSAYWKQVIWNGKPSEDIGKTRAQLEQESPIPSLSDMVESMAKTSLHAGRTLGLG